ncbi:MAG: hypothetical protein ABSC23_00760 [Bryobacteraceae bacterium]
MRRVLHAQLMRGHVAQRAALILAAALLGVLSASVLYGMRTLGL